MTSSNQLELYRAQGALAVLDGFHSMERDLKAIEKQVQDQADQHKKNLAAAEAVLP